MTPMPEKIQGPGLILQRKPGHLTLWELEPGGEPHCLGRFESISKAWQAVDMLDMADSGAPQTV